MVYFSKNRMKCVPQKAVWLAEGSMETSLRNASAEMLMDSYLVHLLNSHLQYLMGADRAACARMGRRGPKRDS